MKIRRAAAKAVVEEITQRLTIKLAQPATVVNVPPSRKSEYPAMALLIDSAEIVIYNDDEDVEFDPSKQIGDDGFELTGYFRTDPVTNALTTGTTYMLDQDTTVSQIGTVRMKGRLWVGARLDAQREQLEQEVSLIFYNERQAPGRIQVSVAGVEISGVKIPFGIATVMFEDEMTWNSEFAFAERLWTYMKISVDAPFMIPRFDPIADKLYLLVSQDLQTAVETPDDLTDLADLRTYKINSGGDPIPV
jgi:hypothetical protein